MTLFIIEQQKVSWNFIFSLIIHFISYGGQTGGLIRHLGIKFHYKQVQRRRKKFLRFFPTTRVNTVTLMNQEIPSVLR